MFDPYLFAAISLIFFSAGLAKGVVGNGLPVISIGLLTTIMGLPEAIAIAAMPSIFSNLWQAASGGHFLALIRRFWPYLVTSSLAVLLGTLVLVRVDAAFLTIILGILIAFYAALGAMGKEFTIPPANEKIAAPIFGFLTGIITGMTGAPAYPGIFFLNGLGLDRNRLVQVFGIAFSVATLTNALSMNGHNLLTTTQLAWSLFAVFPTMIGVIIGTKLRHQMSEIHFRKYFYVSMLALGTYLIARSLFRLT